MTERSGEITFQGKPLTLIGPVLKVGSEAPHFTLTANDLSDLRCDAYHGKILVLSVVRAWTLRSARRRHGRSTSGPRNSPRM